jgi:hypothetical protein
MEYLDKLRTGYHTIKDWAGIPREEKIGSRLGGYLGQLGSQYFPIPGVNGQQFGEWAGSFLPFKEGGIAVHPAGRFSLGKLPMMDSPAHFKKGGRVKRH